MKKLLLVFAFIIGFSGLSSATPFTTTSPTDKGLLPFSVSEIGGIVFDLVGTNGTRVVSQLAASGLHEGFARDTSGTDINPLLIGTQTGFITTITDQLGGGIAQAAVRLTLDDGDTAPGNFDDGDNNLLVNGVNFGDFSTVATQRTSTDGLTVTSSGTGFGNNILSTGFFFLEDATLLASLYSSILTSTEVAFALNDTDPGDNYFDFTQGVDASLINVGTGPVINNGQVPEPTTILLFGMGPLGCAGLGRKR